MCTHYPAPLPKDQLTPCELPVPLDTPVCPFGEACLCTSNTTNATCMPYFGTAGCVCGYATWIFFFYVCISLLFIVCLSASYVLTFPLYRATTWMR